MKIDSNILIQATAQQVWQELTQFSDYPYWNPFIVKIEGQLEAGSRLAVTMRMGNGKTTKFQPELLEVTPDKRLRWLGHLWFPGLFDGEHCFELLPETSGVRLRHYENFSGVFVGLILRMIGNTTQESFEAFNQALKNRVEQKTTKS
ncbi:MAG: SRPBCC family protein [Salibacteraceae bacterium]